MNNAALLPMPCFVHFANVAPIALGLLIVAMGARLSTFVDSDWVRADILPAHQRNVVAKFFAEQIDQPAAVGGLFIAHSVKDGGGGGEILFEFMSVIRVDAFVFFFEADGQGENLAVGEAVEAAHHK